MFTIYAEPNIFEDLIVLDDLYPNLSKIAFGHSDVCLNMDNAALQAELVPGTPIFEYILALGGKVPIALKSYFELIEEDPLVIAEKPRAAFFLNVSPAEALTMENNAGVIVQSGLAINDHILKGTFFKELPKDTILEDTATVGWRNLLSFSLPPSNAIVLTDYYLFANDENGHPLGHSNLVRLLDSVLPVTLAVSYHVTVLASDDGRSEQWCNQLAGRLKAEITRLRPYEINFELVFAKTIHKRKFLQNYQNGACDRGFAVFKAADHKTVNGDNDFRCDRLFQRLERVEGDTDLHSAELILAHLKRLCETVGEFIRNAGASVNYRILGDCKPDKSLRNRLINDV